MKILRLRQDLPNSISINERVILPVREGFIITKFRENKVLSKISEFTVSCCSISSESFQRFSLNFTQMLTLNRWLSYADSMSKTHFTVMGFILEFCVSSISPEPFERSSQNFTQMFLLTKQCAELMSWLGRLKIQIRLQGHVIYPSIHFLSIPPELFKSVSLNATD